MKNLLLIFSLVIALPLSGNGQENGGFEEWDSVSAPFDALEVIGIDIPETVNGSPSMWTYGMGLGILRTTDAYSGLYALIVHTWYGHITETISYEQAIQNTPEYISGYYKYMAVEKEEGGFPKGVGTVIITNSNQDTISLTNFELDTTSTYKYFEFELNQVTDESSANIQIIFENANQQRMLLNCTQIQVRIVLISTLILLSLMSTFIMHKENY